MEEALVRGEGWRGRRRHRKLGPRKFITLVVRKLFVHRVPFCPTFDRLYALQRFLRMAKRWPRHYLYTDRLLWMKISGELLDPMRQFVTDKNLGKEFITARLGAGYVPKTLAVLRTSQEVYDYDFPRECVIKAAHASRRTVICSKDAAIDKRAVAAWLELDYYRIVREQNYAFLRPSVIVEEFAFDGASMLDDYKVFCVEGEPKAIVVYRGRFDDMRQRLYDTDWNSLPYHPGRCPLAEPVSRPALLDQMLEASAKLAKGFSFIRVDLYTDGRTFKVGELTNLPSGASLRFDSLEAERQFSALLFGEE